MGQPNTPIKSISNNHHEKMDVLSTFIEKIDKSDNNVSEVLIMSTFPPRECGIATYTQDLVRVIETKFSDSYKISICAIESEDIRHQYGSNVKYILNPNYYNAFESLAQKINEDPNIAVVVIEHEFGLFRNNENDLLNFLSIVYKPIIISFHTVLPRPDPALYLRVKNLVKFVDAIIVMTKISKGILEVDYKIDAEKISVIPHGTHLVSHEDKRVLKEKHHYKGRKILATFGLLNSGKSIETTLKALPEIISREPNVLFLIIGKTHPSVKKEEGERYRKSLEDLVKELKLTGHVEFINKFVPLPELLELLQLTDIYLFTSKDPNQAVSGTFCYAISCGCAVISTPIPHAREVLGENAGIVIDFESSDQISKAVVELLSDVSLLEHFSKKGIQQIAPTAWENSAIAHVNLIKELDPNKKPLHFNLPPIQLQHLKRMTTDFGILQFAELNQPMRSSGYTLDDTARALIVMCNHYELNRDSEDLYYIHLYLEFIKFCQQPDGRFLNYVNYDKEFTRQNYECNLEDSNGRAIWAVGVVMSMRKILPREMIYDANLIIQKSMPNMMDMHSTRTIAFIILGLYYQHETTGKNSLMIGHLAQKLVQMYKHEAEANWKWFESYLTYANSIIPLSLLLAWKVTGKPEFIKVAVNSFDFLLNHLFVGNRIIAISNNSWLSKHRSNLEKEKGGEQAIDISYTVLALTEFHKIFPSRGYSEKMTTAFDWFHGNNHLGQIVYNPCTGGCYDGLEKENVNLNQGAESLVCYLMARLAIEKFNIELRPQKIALPERVEQVTSDYHTTML